MRKDAYERKSFILHREGESQADALQTAMAVMTIKNGEACFFVRGEALSQGRCYLAKKQSGGTGYVDVGCPGERFSAVDVGQTGLSLSAFDALLYGQISEKTGSIGQVYVAYFTNQWPWKKGKLTTLKPKNALDLTQVKQQPENREEIPAQKENPQPKPVSLPPQKAENPQLTPVQQAEQLSTAFRQMVERFQTHPENSIETIDLRGFSDPEKKPIQAAAKKEERQEKTLVRRLFGKTDQQSIKEETTAAGHIPFASGQEDKRGQNPLPFVAQKEKTAPQKTVFLHQGSGFQSTMSKTIPVTPAKPVTDGTRANTQLRKSAFYRAETKAAAKTPLTPLTQDPSVQTEKKVQQLSENKTLPGGFHSDRKTQSAGQETDTAVSSKKRQEPSPWQVFLERQLRQNGARVAAEEGLMELWQGKKQEDDEAMSTKPQRTLMSGELSLPGEGKQGMLQKSGASPLLPSLPEEKGQVISLSPYPKDMADQEKENGEKTPLPEAEINSDKAAEVPPSSEMDLEAATPAPIAAPEEKSQLFSRSPVDWETLWSAFTRTHTAMAPFSRQDPLWVQVGLAELWMLPLADTEMIQSATAVLGVKKYCHLLLGRDEDGRLFLAVPGCYHAACCPEAEKEGFSDFWTVPSGDTSEGCYGYWIGRLR